MHNILELAIGAAPVSTVDVDAVVAKARRHNVRRRLAIASAAGGTALVAAGVVATLTMTLSAATIAGRPPATDPMIRIQPGSSTPSTPSAPTHDGETREQAAQRLATALSAAIVAAIPGTQVNDGQTGQAPLTVAFDDTATVNGTPVNFPRFTAEAVLSGTGSSEVFLESRPGGPDPAPTTDPSAQPVGISFVDACDETSHAFQFEDHSALEECAQTAGPAGQTVVLVSERCLDCPGQPVFRIDAYVTWANARVNVGVISILKHGGPSQVLIPPLLTAGQVVDIATNPDLAVTS
jgi:hypothetical protein